MDSIDLMNALCAEDGHQTARIEKVAEYLSDSERFCSSDPPARRMRILALARRDNLGRRDTSSNQEQKTSPGNKTETEIRRREHGNTRLILPNFADARIVSRSSGHWKGFTCFPGETQERKPAGVSLQRPIHLHRYPRSRPTAPNQSTRGPGAAGEHRSVSASAQKRSSQAG
jgi:hypothetical protein